MRPVPTWNSTAADPAPIRLGPRPGTPWPFCPWQVMQVVSYSCLPCWAAVDSGGVSSARVMPGAAAV
jgi:hypothetical protein